MGKVLLVALAGLLLAGCQTSVPTREHYIGTGALSGAATGALIGAAQGSAAGLWGAGIGAVAGGVVGYAMLPATQGVCYWTNPKTGVRETVYCYF